MPGVPEGALYRTGDRARYLTDGRVQVLGRRDSQIKLRGFRIELGEIEAVMARAGVASGAVTLATVGGAQRLVGYFVEREGTPRSPTELMDSLGSALPDYMVPGLWVRLDRMPMTANGKIDRRALPPPDPDAMRPAGAKSEPPRTKLEAALAAIWTEVLGIDRIGIHDNLFALGADSIHLFRITARMMRDGIGLTARHLVEHPTIAELAAIAPDVAPPLAMPSLADFARARRAKLSA